MHWRVGLDTRAEGPEAVAAESIQQRLSHHATGGISLAHEQNIECSKSHFIENLVRRLKEIARISEGRRTSRYATAIENDTRAFSDQIITTEY